jgi:arylsulfatase A-like enzyme
MNTGFFFTTGPQIMPDSKNVLFVIADQFRADCIAAAGNPAIRTPNLDYLASQGVLFPKCIVQAAPCGPSRMCIFTSRYLCSTRSLENMTPLADAEENLAAHLREGGYASGIIGYNDYAVDPRILEDGDPRKAGLSYDNFLPGFDVVYKHEFHSPGYFDYLREKGYPEELCGPRICEEYDVPPEGPGDRLPLRYPAFYKAEDSECQFLTSKATDFIEGQKEGGWFLSLNYIKPHPPRICPAPYHEMYDPKEMPVPARSAEELETSHPYLARVRKEPLLQKESELRETQACYYGMVSEIDACVGRLIQSLKDTGQWDNTLVVFTSDHGEYLGDHYLTDKGHFYDGALRVPFLVRDPSRQADVTRGQILDGFVESVDAAPTVLEYLGVPVPDRFQGRSVLNQIRDLPDVEVKDTVFHEFDFRGQFMDSPEVDPDTCLLWVVRDDRFKYVQFAREEMPPLLFDLQRDPKELCNLAADFAHTQTLLEYCQKLLRWRMKHEDQRMEHWAAPYRLLTKANGIRNFGNEAGNGIRKGNLITY